MSITIRKLNAGIAIGAASVAQVPGAVAAEGDTTSITLEGGAAISEFTRDKVGAPEGEVDDDLGLYGSVEVVRSISPGWDWSVGATGLNFAPNVITDDEDDASYTSEFDVTTVNFDIGKQMNQSGVNLRFAAGIEALGSSRSKGLSFFDSPDSYFNSDATLDFLGAGPRVSADASMALGDGSQWSVYGGASAAKMRGVYTLDKGVSGQNPEPFGGRETDDEAGSLTHTVLDAGIQYQVSDSTSFRAGIRRDIFKPDGNIADSTFFEDTVTSDTAYVGVSINF